MKAIAQQPNMLKRGMELFYQLQCRMKSPMK
jgi:hypothetical protein